MSELEKQIQMLRGVAEKANEKSKDALTAGAFEASMETGELADAINAVCNAASSQRELDVEERIRALAEDKTLGISFDPSKKAGQWHIWREGDRTSRLNGTLDEALTAAEKDALGGRSATHAQIKVKAAWVRGVISSLAIYRWYEAACGHPATRGSGSK